MKIISMLMLACLSVATAVAQDTPTFTVSWPAYTSAANGAYVAADHEIAAECAFGAVGNPWREVARVRQPGNSTGEITHAEAAWSQPVRCRIRAYYRPTQQYSADYSPVVSGVFGPRPSAPPARPTGITLQISTTTFTPVAPIHTEAEDYAAFSDLSAGNKGNVYRTDDVDIWATTDEGGGYMVGDNQAGEWLEYAFDLPVEGEYVIEIRAARADANPALFNVDIDGAVRVPSVEAPTTGGWNTFTTVRLPPVVLSAGAHRLRLTFVQRAVNINWIRIQP